MPSQERRTSAPAAAPSPETESATTGPAAPSNSGLLEQMRTGGLFGSLVDGLRNLFDDGEDDGSGQGQQAPAAARTAPAAPTPVAEAQADGSVTVHGNARIGPFDGTYEGLPRAAVIAQRLASLGNLSAADVERADGGSWAVTVAGTRVFTVKQADAEAGGFLDARLAAHTWAAAVAQRPVPDAVLGGEQGFLSKAENDALMAARSGVEVESGGTIVAHGVRLGPFTGDVDGRPRAEVIAERLGKVPSSAFRGAKAEGDKVVIGDTSFTVTAADAAAMGVRTAKDGAARQAGALVGTWAKGAYDEPGRRVMPATMSSAALFEFARGVAEGPGHTAVSTEPGHVTIVGIRGVGTDGVYDPQLKAEDDVVVPLVVDAEGKRLALELSGTVDPGGVSGGATQVGDDAAEFHYMNWSGNKNLAGVGMMRATTGIEGKDVGRQVQEYDDMTSRAYDQSATLIHFGTAADQSRGCTVITDEGRYFDNKKDLTNLHNQGLHTLDADARLQGSEALANRGAERDAKTQKKVDGLEALRRNEEAVAKKNEGKPVSASELAAVSNYKAFLSMVYRDADLKVTYVIVDGSKIKSVDLPEKAQG